MKDYNAMAESVLSRRDKYVRERRKQMKKITTAISCFCLCALLGAGAWQSGIFDSNAAVDAGIDGSEYGSGAIIQGSANTTEDSSITKGEKDMPAVENSASEKASGSPDAIGWLIWQGKEYTQQSASREEKETLEQYLGAVTGFEGFYKNSGVGGSLYTVKDSSTLLCAKLDNGAYIYLSCSKEKAYDAPVQNEMGNSGAIEAPDSKDWGTVWGGSYMDENGNCIVWLTEDTAENRAEVFQRNPSLNQNSTVFKKAEYSLEYLTKIMTGISRAMSEGRLNSVTGAALREDINRVAVYMNCDNAATTAKVFAFDDLGGAIEIICDSTASTEEMLIQKSPVQ